MQKAYFEKSQFLLFQITALRQQHQRFKEDKERAGGLFERRAKLVIANFGRWQKTLLKEYFEEWQYHVRERQRRRHIIMKFIERWRSNPVPRTFRAWYCSSLLHIDSTENYHSSTLLALLSNNNCCLNHLQN